MYISAAEFNMIISALTFAADRVLESNGEIGVFTGAIDFYNTDEEELAWYAETNMQDAQAAKELVARLEAADVFAKDWALIAEVYDKDTCTWDVCMDLINELYYDDYGRLRKTRYAVPTIDEWIAETKRTHTVGLDVFPAEAIERAHDFIGDLWLDNEQHGDHHPDGTFNTGK